MNVRTLKANLLENPDKNVRFILPEGEPIPPEFHVTEVGHSIRRFIDCGGTKRSQESCLLQAWVSEENKRHRLTAKKLAKILELGREVVPSDEFNVEVEYYSRAVAHYTVDSFVVTEDKLDFTLGHKKTDCLARESCGVGSEPSGCGCGETVGKCC